MAQIALLEGQVKEVDVAIAHLVAGVAQHLTSIPGVGPILAATILPEIGDVDRFGSNPRRALVAFAGLDPTVFVSGTFQDRHQHMSKRGSPYLRRALFLGAYSAHLHNPDLGAFLDRKLAQEKPYRAAVVALAQRLLARCYAVLKEGHPYAVR